MRSPAYRCSYAPDDNGTLLVSCVAFPELVTYGATPEEARAHAANAIEEAIAARISEGRDVPTSTRSGKSASAESFVVRLSPLIAQKVMLYNLLAELGLSRAELGRRLNWHREQVDRLFRLDHASKASQLDAAFRALGHEVEIIVTKRGTPAGPGRAAA